MSRSPYTLYVGTNLTQRVKPVLMAEDEAQTLTVDLSAYCGMEDTEIVTATWADLGTSASIGAPTTDTKTTSALVAVADGGDSELQVSVLLDNAEVLVFQFNLINSDAFIADRTDYH